MPLQDDLWSFNLRTIFYRKTCRELITSDPNSGVGTYGDDINDILSEGHTESGLSTDTSGGSNLNGGDDFKNDGLSTAGIVAVIFEIRVSIVRT